METPFIQVFRTPNSCYFLDVNKNELVPVSRASFHYLCALLSGKDDGEEPVPQELHELHAQGYLASESAVKEVRHPYTKFIGTFLDRKLAKITLQLTQNCNFRCKYCIYSEEHNVRQRSHSTEHMSWEVAKKAVDFLWSHSVDSKSANIGFYGGEPLLEFPLIQRVVEYCEELFLGKELTFSITTNGTLLSDEMIHYFRAHDVALMISLDGPKEINDQNRIFADGRGTYDVVMKRIARLREIAPEYADKLQISMVMDPQNDFDCINAIYLEGDTLDNLGLMPSIVDREYDGAKVDFSEAYTWKYEYQRFLAVLSYWARFPEEKVSPIVQYAVDAARYDELLIGASRGLRGVDSPSGPCVPGQMRLLVDVVGRLFPCERVSERSAAMCIGTLDKGFDVENASRLLNVGRLTEAACKQCWCFRYCTMCARGADAGSDVLSTDAKLSFCEEVRASAYSKIRQHLFLKEVPLFYATQVRSTNVERSVSI